MIRDWILAAAVAAAATHIEPYELKQDEFDAPAPASVAEAAKASGGAVTHDHGEEALYACPMHPEVTSATPGSCPKCGMTLVKKGGS